MAKVLSEPDDGSAGRKFRKGERDIPEQLGSAIRVDGKPLKPEKILSRPAKADMPDAPNFKPMFDKIRAEASEAADRDEKASRTNAMGDTFKKGGKVSSASRRADGIAQRGKTRGTMVMCGGGMVRK